MENASKALLIAGEILIAILILSLAVYLITSYSSTEEAYQETMTNKQIEAYNAKFTQYIEYDSTGKMYITAQNLITIGNLAENIKNEQTITVTQNGKSNSQLVEYLMSDTEKMYTDQPYCDYKTDNLQIVYFNIKSIVRDSSDKINEIIICPNRYYKSGNTFMLI